MTDKFPKNYITMCQRAKACGLLSRAIQPGDHVLLHKKTYICVTPYELGTELITGGGQKLYLSPKASEDLIWLPELGDIAGMLPGGWKWFRINEKYPGGSVVVTITWTTEGGKYVSIADTEIEARFHAVIYARCNVKWNAVEQDWGLA